MIPYLLNVLDLLLTLYALQHGGVELNPLMQSVPVMVGWKVLGVGVLCYLLERLAKNFRVDFRVARRGLRLCAVVYGALCIYHFYFIFGGA